MQTVKDLLPIILGCSIGAFVVFGLTALTPQPYPPAIAPVAVYAVYCLVCLDSVSSLNGHYLVIWIAIGPPLPLATALVTSRELLSFVNAVNAVVFLITPLGMLATHLSKTSDLTALQEQL